MMGNPAGIIILIFAVIAMLCFALLVITLGSVFLRMYLARRGGLRVSSGETRFPTFQSSWFPALRLAVCLVPKTIITIAVITISFFMLPIFWSDRLWLALGLSWFVATIVSMVVYVPMLLTVGRLKSNFKVQAILATTILEVVFAVISPIFAYLMAAFLDS